MLLCFVRGTRERERRVDERHAYCYEPHLCGTFDDIAVGIAHHCHEQIQEKNRHDDDVEDKQRDADVVVVRFGVRFEIEIAQHAEKALLHADEETSNA